MDIDHTTSSYLYSPLSHGAALAVEELDCPASDNGIDIAVLALLVALLLLVLGLPNGTGVAPEFRNAMTR